MDSPINAENRRRGMSMVELVIVTMLLGILAAVAAPRFAQSLQYHRVEMAAKRIIADLEAAQSLAYSSGSAQRIVFDDPPHTYKTIGVANPDRPAEIDSLVALNDDPYYCAFSSLTFTSLTFNGHGLPDRGGTLVIQHGGLSRTITVNPTSGKATYE
jgi:prepilin-type N-terminal cleavage/methylation domain-containing protein